MAKSSKGGKKGRVEVQELPKAQQKLKGGEMKKVKGGFTRSQSDAQKSTTQN
ncbi:MAG TPA: hypothetical protein VF546_24270 [Pyrinomonadaceae bacterium]|jgi:hypothetical protein